MESHLSRRTALLAIGGATAVAAVPVAAIASGPSVDGSAWNRAFAKMEQAKAAYAAEDARFQPISNAYKEAVAAVPHITLRPDPYSARFEPVTTADLRFVRECRKLVQDVNEGRCWLETITYPSLKEHYILAQEVAAAADTRDAEIARIDERLGYTLAVERQEGACNAFVDAESELHEIPSPDGAALLWKMENLWLGDEESGWSEPIVSGILADARRLLSNGRV